MCGGGGAGGVPGRSRGVFVSCLRVMVVALVS